MQLSARTLGDDCWFTYLKIKEQQHLAPLIYAVYEVSEEAKLALKLIFAFAPFSYLPVHSIVKLLIFLTYLIMTNLSSDDVL